MFVMPTVRRCLITACGALVFALAVTPSLAQQSEQLASANERINFSGKLRMLSQRAAAAGCNLAAEIDVSKSRQILTLTSAEFGKILDGLKNGSSDLKISSAETNDAVLSSLQVLNDRWQTFDSALLNLSKDSQSAADIELINVQNMAVLESAQQLVKSVLDSYSGNADADDGGFSKVIDIAGRQRMLTQKMSKEACQIWSNQNTAESLEALSNTMELFEVSLSSLRQGSDGLIEPPNERIEQGLSIVWDEWVSIKPLLEKALASQTVEIQGREQLARDLDQMLRDMNSVVGLYTVAQKESGNISDEGASERVNFSGKLRMLTQRIAASACNYAAGVEPKQNKERLSSAQAEFVKIMNALELGDADLRIYGKEKQRKTLDALSKVNEAWVPFSDAVELVLNDEQVEESIAIIVEQNMNLLSAAKLLVSEISGQYSDPSVMTQGDAMLIDISGRQRMLSQKISKEACLIWSGQIEIGEDLTETMQVFELSLLALRDGLESAGIKAAPTAEIMYGLEGIFEQWQNIRPNLQKANSGEVVDVEERAELAQDLEVILADMNALVALYTIYGKTGL